MKTKICNKCGEIKSINEFSKDLSKKDKLSSLCKKCKSEHKKKYYKNNTEKCREYSKKYREKNPERYKKIRKRWRENNPEYQKEYRKNNPVKHWSYATIKNHRSKGFKILFESKDLILIAKNTKKCPICDCKLDWKYGTGLNDNTPNLDRINNEKILTLDNTQIICWRCNRAKGQMNMKEFINYCKHIADKY